MRFEKILKDKRFGVTLEVQPPIETGLESLIEKIDRVYGRIDAISVSESKNEGGVTDIVGTCRSLKDHQFEPILQITCREKSRIDIQEHLIKASEAGIENILAFKDDYRISGDSLQEMMFFHVDSVKLFSVLESLQKGRDITGRELQKRSDFCVGAGIDSSWGKEIPDLELEEMEKLAGQGTDFFVSTPVFDLDSFDQFMNRVRPIGVPVIAEVAIIRSAETGHFLNRHVKPETVPNHVIERIEKSQNRENESIEMVVKLVEGLKDLCQGVYLIPMGAEDQLSKYLDALNL
jgi:5,10-methylenetetrahydrofolate reductase